MSRTRLVLAVGVVVLCAAAYHFFNRCGGRIDRFWDSLSSLVPPSRNSDEADLAADAEPARPLPPADPGRQVVRIATFKLGALDQRKLADRQVCDLLVRTVTQFDLLALQDVRARNQGLLLELVRCVNETGADYDFAVSPLVGRDSMEQYSAFLYNRASIETDPAMVATIQDPQGRFTRPPLTGAFRVRGPGERQAFTFTVISAQIDPTRGTEQDLLADVFRAVRDDGRDEDDVILLGNLLLNEDRYERLDRTLGLVPVLVGAPTTVRGGLLADNILINLRATTEYTGRAQVFDLMREFDRSLQDVQALSDNLPVWAEFHVREGGETGGALASDPADRPAQ